MKLATGRRTRTPTRSTRSGCPRARPTTWSRSSITFPSGPHRRRDLPDRDRGPGLVRAHGRAHLPPLAGTPRPTWTAPTSCGSTSTPSPAPTFARRRPGGRRGAASCSTDLGIVGFAEDLGNRGVHIYVRIEPRVGVRRRPARRDRVRPRARAARRPGDHAWWKEERGERIFVDFNQNCRDRTIASAYSLRPMPGAPVSTPLAWEELAEITDPRRPQPLHGAGAARRPATRGLPSTTSPTACEPLLDLWRRAGRGRAATTRPTIPRCPASRPGCSRARRSPSTGTRHGNWIGGDRT